jgi:cob(I)alamin adenosyltransferase
MKIYTRFGDQGKTRLVGGDTVDKDHLRVCAYGSVDELNSSLGICLTLIQDPELSSTLRKIQNELFNVGSLLACEDFSLLSSLPQVSSGHIDFLEGKIDLYTEKLPALKNFILPGGSPAAAHLHLSRTICRRSERELVSLIKIEGPIESLQTCLTYLNRLSDLLFTCARYANYLAKIPDEIWQK